MSGLSTGNVRDQLGSSHYIKYYSFSLKYYKVTINLKLKQSFI